MFGRDLPGKDQRAEWARRWVARRHPWTLAAGLLGVLAPIDGLIFFPLSIAAVVAGVVGWRRVERTPGAAGRGLCVIGIVGGLLGLGLAAALHLWDGQA